MVFFNVKYSYSYLECPPEFSGNGTVSLQNYLGFDCTLFVEFCAMDNPEFALYIASVTLIGDCDDIPKNIYGMPILNWQALWLQVASSYWEGETVWRDIPLCDKPWENPQTYRKLYVKYGGCFEQGWHESYDPNGSLQIEYYWNSCQAFMDEELTIPSGALPLCYEYYKFCYELVNGNFVLTSEPTGPVVEDYYCPVGCRSICDPINYEIN